MQGPELKVFNDKETRECLPDRKSPVPAPSAGGEWPLTTRARVNRKRGLEHEDLEKTNVLSPSYSPAQCASYHPPTTITHPTGQTELPDSVQCSTPFLNTPPPTATIAPLRPILQPQSRSRVRAFRHKCRREQQQTGATFDQLGNSRVRREEKTMEWAPSEPDCGEANFLVEDNWHDGEV